MLSSGSLPQRVWASLAASAHSQTRRGLTPTRFSVGNPNDVPPCDEYVYEPPADDSNLHSFPANIHIERISPVGLPVSIYITNVSADPPQHVLSCTADSMEETQLVFDLDPESKYRIEAVLHRSGYKEYGKVTVTWKSTTDSKSAILMESRNQKFDVRMGHIDIFSPMSPPTPRNSTS